MLRYGLIRSSCRQVKKNFIRMLSQFPNHLTLGKKIHTLTIFKKFWRGTSYNWTCGNLLLKNVWYLQLRTTLGYLALQHLVTSESVLDVSVKLNVRLVQASVTCWWHFARITCRLLPLLLRLLVSPTRKRKHSADYISASFAQNPKELMSRIMK